MISAKQTHVTPQALQKYRNLSSWKQLRQWHRQYTPSINDETFRLYMKSYNGDAKQLYSQGKLSKSHFFMLSQGELKGIQEYVQDGQQKQEVEKIDK